MTYSEELYNKLKFLDCFYGVFSCDRLPRIEQLPASMIMNTDPHDKPGEHWVALHIDSNKFGVYFDSYGFRPLKYEFAEYLDDNCDWWVFNHTMIQGYNTITCGQYCTLFILLKALNYNLYQIITLFTNDYKVNDEIIKEIYKSL